jgi:hypothetical protein
MADMPPEAQDKAKFKVGDYVKLADGVELAGRYVVTEPSEWNFNSPMLVVAEDGAKGAEGLFTCKRENTVVGVFDGRLLKKVPAPETTPPPPLVPDQIP